MRFFRRKPEPPPKPRPLPRCAMCGNPMIVSAPVQTGRGYLGVCERCVQVIKDRTSNMVLGKPLLTTEVPEWRPLP